jgi:hypothetical protein
MRKPETFSHVGWPVTALAATLAASLGGCGSADNPAAPTSSFNAKARKLHQPNHVAQPGEEDLADMVAAVSATRAGPDVELKFVLTQKPEVGQPLSIDVALVPRSPTFDSVSIAFQVPEGMDIVEGAESVTTPKPVIGEPLRHVLRILPRRDGIFAVTAVVSVTSTDQAATRTFAIPVIAGEGISELAAKPEASKGL